MVNPVEFAQNELTVRRRKNKKSRGEHVITVQSLFVQLCISETAYFGHAYIGTFCCPLSTLPIAMAIKQTFSLCFPRKAGETRRQCNASMNVNAQYQEMYCARHNWIHWLVKSILGVPSRRWWNAAESFRGATESRQEDDRLVTRRRQESGRLGTGSDRQATGRQQGSCDRRATGGQQGGDREVSGRQQQNNTK